MEAVMLHIERGTVMGSRLRERRFTSLKEWGINSAVTLHGGDGFSNCLKCFHWLCVRQVIAIAVASIG